MKEKNQFEDLVCWQTARELCKVIFSLTSKEPFLRDNKFVSQIRSSSGSGMDNIAEGFERGGNKELIQFLYIAKGSFGETRSQIYRALDQKYITSEDSDTVLELAFTACKQTQSLINSLFRSNYRGYKYK